MKPADGINAQIKFIDPLIIVCLGALATKTLINPQASHRIRGQWFEKNGIKILLPIILLPFFESGKEASMEDFQN